MNGINKVIYEAIAVKDPKDGQWGKWWSYGIKINDEWWNGSLKSQEQVDGMLARKGQEVELFFWVDSTKDPKYANKVRFVTDKDRKEAPKENNELDDFKYQSPEVALAEAIKRIEALEKEVFGEKPDEGTPFNQTPAGKPTERSEYKDAPNEEKHVDDKANLDLPF